MNALGLKDMTRRWISGLFDEGNFDLIGTMASENGVFYLNRLQPFDADRIVEDWELYDEFRIMKQLGVIPESE